MQARTLTPPESYEVDRFYRSPIIDYDGDDEAIVFDYESDDE